MAEAPSDSGAYATAQKSSCTAQMVVAGCQAKWTGNSKHGNERKKGAISGLAGWLTQ